MERNNAQFTKSGNNIMPKPSGVDYDLVNGKIYDLVFIPFVGLVLKENGEFNLPKKIYESSEDKVFKHRIFKYFNSSESKDMNILLAGEKGTGKTMLAKTIAKESNLPIIIIDPDVRARDLMPFFKKFNTPVCIILDEIEKNYETEDMLDFLDGLEKTTRKMVIMTCNRKDYLSEYLMDRCSRIRYVRNYTIEDNYEFIPMIAKDLGIKNIDEVIKFCKEYISLPSIDNINAFFNEIKLMENEDVSLEDIVKYMNIELKKSINHKEEEQLKKLQEPEGAKEINLSGIVESLKNISKSLSTESSTVPEIEPIDLDWDDEEAYDDDMDNPLYDEAA